MAYSANTSAPRYTCTAILEKAPPPRSSIVFCHEGFPVGRSNTYLPSKCDWDASLVVGSSWWIISTLDFSLLRLQGSFDSRSSFANLSTHNRVAGNTSSYTFR